LKNKKFDKYYTVENSQTANKIKKDLDLIINNILSFVKFCDAIILLGGFGRGEGSIFLNNNGDIIALNDYDLLILSENQIDKNKLKTIGNELAKKIGIDAVDIGWMHPDTLKKLRPTIINYELKYGSRVVYGNKHILDDAPDFSPTDIPRSEALILMFNRIAGILGETSIKSTNQNASLLHDERRLRIQIYKALIACGDVLLIFKRLYHHLYIERRKLFKELNCSFLLSSYEKEIICNAYNEKLFPQQKYANNVLEELKKCVCFIEKILKWSLQDFLNTQENHLTKIINIYRFGNGIQWWRKNILKVNINHSDSEIIKRSVQAIMAFTLFCAPYYKKQKKILKTVCRELSIREKKLNDENYLRIWEKSRERIFYIWEKKFH